MAIRTVVTSGFGNGTFDGTIALVVTRGYGAGAAVAPVVAADPQVFGTWTRIPIIYSGAATDRVLPLDSAVGSVGVNAQADGRVGQFSHVVASVAKGIDGGYVLCIYSLEQIQKALGDTMPFDPAEELLVLTNPGEELLALLRDIDINPPSMLN